ncbi:N-acetyltransferase [Alternaria panax]|uniref:N-acetyltransferase n=1 Tax=Alternaria panax TaxID=48097 RepID=A0AAD4NNB4_9PLEO|nr:N-acetyltransferase [Alternaria panax]
MSSGNPFRLSQAPRQPAAVPQTSFINTDSSVSEARREDSDHVLEAAAPPPTKTKKSVRILSPTTTIPPYAFDDKHVTLNELRARRSSQGPPASPPPPVTPAGYANSSVTAGEANAQVIGKDAMATADVSPSPSPYSNPPQAVLSPSNVPANPFSRTLASLGPQERGGDEERTDTERPRLGSSRASLDVESFKNLLMTGQPTGKLTPRPSGPPASALQPVAGAQFETSSSTDASSVSRQSLFEPPRETYADSPRTSIDMAESDEDESMGLVSEVKKGKKKPPPAPKHRYGKLVTQRQPQVVSFESFTATEPAPAPPPAIRRTDSSDTNKPLPPTPAAAPQSLHISTQDTTPLQSPTMPPIRSQPSTPLEGSTRQKKTPPPVPLARRQSQLKTTTTGNRSRSSSNLTISSQHPVEVLQSPGSSTLDPSFGVKSPPPPPPSRHGARLANLGNSSANSSSTELPQRSSSGRMPRSLPESRSSRRSTLESQPSSPAPSVHRTSSISSNRNTNRNVSGESIGSTMPPPPPPPRRRQSNRSSLDQQRPYVSYSSPTESRRTSTEYRRTSTEHRRSSVASERSLKRTYAPVGEKGENEHALYSPVEESEMRLGLDENVSGGKIEVRSDSSNILYDMEEFQREIDELRTRFKPAG